MIAQGTGVGLLLVALAAVVGCDAVTADLYTCPIPDKLHVAADGQLDPCHDRDADAGEDAAADAGPQCERGEFVHWRLPWQPPTLLWFGPPDQVPECPLGPKTIAYEGETDLVAPIACEECTCELPTGSCALPSKLTASANACSMPGGPSTSFNAPDPWDGQCDSTTQTPDGVAHSLTIDPIAMTEAGCAVGPPVAAKLASLHWNTLARACDVFMPEGPVARSICLPDDPLPPGFKVCIFSDGVSACPDDVLGNTFTEQHIFYGGAEDDRQCSPCGCGAPTGSACTATMSIYKGNNLTCAGPPLILIPVSSTSPTCLDVQLPGQALGSKAASPPTYLPGVCPPMGGEPSGSAIPKTPATLCCRP
jgi:hypothetical protein